MHRVAIVGAAGYAGVELTRLVLGHPSLELVMVTSTSDAGTAVADLYPALAGCSLRYVEPDVCVLAQVADLVFLAVPHTAAAALAPALLEAGCTVIDASADFRLRDVATYEHWYGAPHAAPELVREAVYGLPEFARASLPSARLVAVPGCYPTATLLAAAPAVQAGVVSDARVIVAAISGVSGAGRTPSTATHFPQANESVAAYKAAAHRHIPEIAQQLEGWGLAHPQVVFVPHLAPMTRGLLATVHLTVDADLTLDDAHQLYATRYAGEPFVTVHPPSRMPATGEVRGSNRAHLGLALDEASSTLIVSCAIDNLVKGTAGQAVQCANIVLGLPETLGLDAPVPVI